MTKYFFIALIFFLGNNWLSYAENLIISEVMPNPVGSDSGNEWVELFNLTDSQLDLSSYTLTVNDKNYQLTGEMAAKSPETLTIGLPNNETKIQLSKNSQPLDSIHYLEAKEGLSYSKIVIQQGQKPISSWIWTTPTPSAHNSLLQVLTGQITTSPQIAQEYFFEVDGQKILFEENQHPFSITQKMLPIGQNVSVLYQLNSKKQKIMQKFKLQNTILTKETRTSPPAEPLLISGIIILGTILFLERPINHLR